MTVTNLLLISLTFFIFKELESCSCRLQKHSIYAVCKTFSFKIRHLIELIDFKNILNPCYFVTFL